LKDHLVTSIDESRERLEEIDKDIRNRMGEIERIKDKMTLFKKKYKEFADVMRD
jgi:archaellum component FlaC